MERQFLSNEEQLKEKEKFSDAVKVMSSYRANLIFLREELEMWHEQIEREENDREYYAETKPELLRISEGTED